MTNRTADLAAEILTAFQALDEAAQDIITALPHQMTNRAFRLDGARIAFRSTLQRLAHEAAGAFIDTEALGGAFAEVRRPEAS